MDARSNTLNEAFITLFLMIVFLCYLCLGNGRKSTIIFETGPHLPETKHPVAALPGSFDGIGEGERPLRKSRLCGIHPVRGRMPQRGIRRDYRLRRLSQYAVGVIPVSCLNILLRCCGYSNPSLYAACAMPVPAVSSFFARWMTYRRM